ncbi:MAG: hypothetical protein PHQ17_03140 [Methanobacterium sp.]|nr:hypothetical protein [Methanobacterium sp.]
MKREDILNDERVQDFIDERDISEGSVTNLVTALNKYCGLHKMTPTELIDEAREDQRNIEYVTDRRIKKRLTRFRRLMLNEGARATYARTIMQLIRGFYGEYEVVLPKVSMKKFPVHRKKEDEIPDKYDIRKALKNANLQMKAIILLKASSGMDSVTLRKLTYKQFLDGLEEELKGLGKAVRDPFDFEALLETVGEEDIIINWTLERSKVGNYRHYTNSTPETTRAILDYLYQKPPTDINSPLFRTRGRPDDFIEEDTLIVNFRTINNKCKFGKVGTYAKFHAHALRTYFATTLLRHGVRKEYADFMMGHIVDETSSSYFVPTKAGIREQYEKVVDYLAVQETAVTKVEDKALKEFKEKIRELEAQVAAERALRVQEQERNEPKMNWDPERDEPIYY